MVNSEKSAFRDFHLDVEKYITESFNLHSEILIDIHNEDDSCIRIQRNLHLIFGQYLQFIQTRLTFRIRKFFFFQITNINIAFNFFLKRERVHSQWNS